MRGFVRRAYIALRRPGQFAVALAVSVASAAAAPSPVQMRSDVAYGPLPAEQADLYLPDMPRAHRPAVVIIHGGGWVSGSRHSNDYFATMLAAQGVVVLNIDYRLADKAVPQNRWPAQLVDAQLAVRFLRANAAELGVDTGRLGAVGDSAGAQLAVFLGTTPRIVAGDQAGLYANLRPDVKAVVDQFGPMDLPGMGTYGVGSVEAMFGTTTPPPADLLTASPLPSITGRSAAVYIIHGHEDRVVPFDASRQLVDALQSHKVAVDFVPYDGDHGYAGLKSEQISKLQNDAIAWLVARLQH